MAKERTEYSFDHHLANVTGLPKTGKRVGGGIFLAQHLILDARVTSNNQL